jgi:hypothetical protein
MKKRNQVVQLFLFFFSIAFSAQSQNVAINSTGASPNSSSILDLTSANKGVLIPRVSLTSLTDAATIPTPATSLLIYNTNAAITNGTGYYYNNGTPASPVWVKFVVVDNTGIVTATTPGGEVIKLDRFPMGEVSMQGNTTLTNISSANNWVKAAGTTSFSAGSYQFSNGGVNNRLVYTGSSMKMFHIACTLSVKATNSGSNMKAVLYKNGVALSKGIVQTKMGSNSDIISTAIHVMTDMQNGDYLELWITNTVGSDDFTVTEMNMFAMGVSMGMD